MPAALDDIITNIAQGDDGVWRTTMQSAVSYPEQGHDNSLGVEDGSFWFGHRNRCIAAVIGHDPPDRNLPFFDVGGGNGYVARMIGGLGFRVVLVEPGATGIAHARARGVDELVQASLVDLDIVPGTLGAIGLFDVLEHIQDDEAALRAMHGMLADGGKLYATVPAHRWLWSTVDVQAGHFRRYTTAQLKALLARCGFQARLCSYYFWPLPPPMYVLRSLPEWLHLRRVPKPRAERVNSEHLRRSRLLESMLSLEARALSRGRSLPFGASCILVAHKASRGRTWT